MHASIIRPALGLILCFAAAVLSAPARAGEPVLDLGVLAARGEMPPAVEVATGDDIVYGRPMRYRGYRLRDLLATLANLDALRAAGAEVVFTAEDGYVATMALDDALAADGVVAVRDLDAPAGQDWQTFKQGKTTTTSVPYYLVWPNRDPDDVDLFVQLLESPERRLPVVFVMGRNFDGCLPTDVGHLANQLSGMAYVCVTDSSDVTLRWSQKIGQAVKVYSTG